MAKSKNTKFKIETTQSWVAQFKRPTRIKIKFERPSLDQLMKEFNK